MFVHNFYSYLDIYDLIKKPLEKSLSLKDCFFQIKNAIFLQNIELTAQNIFNISL